MKQETAELVAILNDPAREIDWDGCWDLLMPRDEELKSCIPELLQLLEGVTEIARIFALRKLRELKVDLTLWEEQLCRRLADVDYVVRLEAFAAANDVLTSSKRVRQAMRAMANRRSEYLWLRIRAWWLLLRATPRDVCRG